MAEIRKMEDFSSKRQPVVRVVHPSMGVDAIVIDIASRTSKINELRAIVADETQDASVRELANLLIEHLTKK